MSSISEPIQKHVPAWKRLGLKLKFAKEEPEDPQSGQNGVVERKKRKAPPEEEVAQENALEERFVKKAKKLKREIEEVGEVVNGNGTSHETQDKGKSRKKINNSKDGIVEPVEAVNVERKPSNERADSERPSKKPKESKMKTDVSTISINGKVGGTHEQKISPPPPLRTTPASNGKSVSFTPDTKTKDGDSVKGLYKTWIAKQIAIDPSFDPSTVSPALRSIVPPHAASPDSPSPVTSTLTSKSDTTTEDNKAPIKKRKTRLPKTSSGPGPSRFDPVLTYLTTHHTSPQTWKFSKPHQNQILKHLFSLRHIPSSYDSALLPYIRGLKGTSARSRIRKEALAICEEDEKWLASEPSETEKMENETIAQCIARRRCDYEAAVARIKQTLRESEEEREERDWEVLGGKQEWEERVSKRRRAEIVLWNVGQEEETAKADGVASTQLNTLENKGERPLKSGLAQSLQPLRDPGPAPRVGRGVGMGMGGVEVIDAEGIARGSQGKKVVFNNDGTAQAGAPNGVNAFGGANGVRHAKEANGFHTSKTPESGNGTNGVKPKRKRKRKRRTGVPDDDDDDSSSSSSSGGESEGEGKRKKKEKEQKTNLKKDGSSDDETSSSDSDSGSSSSSSADSDSD